MATDPRKNDEVKDEELEGVAGGAGGDRMDEQPDDGSHGDPLFTVGKAGRQRT